MTTMIINPVRWLLAALEPWYDWGTIHIERMQGMTLDSNGYHTADAEGPVRYFQVQRFGIHLGFQIGRTPKREG